MPLHLLMDLEGAGKVPGEVVRPGIGLDKQGVGMLVRGGKGGREGRGRGLLLFLASAS
jgi:hypothetical protein